MKGEQGGYDKVLSPKGPLAERGGFSDGCFAPALQQGAIEGDDCPPLQRIQL